MPTNIFVTGITGYIGGTVVQHLLRRPDAGSFNITALVRAPEKAEKLKIFGINAIVGSLGDLELVEKLASEADVVIAMADADDLAGTHATLRGLKTRYESTGKVPILINTSGTGVLAVDTKGNSAYDTIYDDLDPDQIESLAITQPHRNVDVTIVEADKQGYVRTYIILPSTIYGISKGDLVDAGIVHPYSQQIPGLIRAALDRGQGGYIGKGKNIWNNVDIDEVAELFTIVFDAAQNNTAGHGREGYYFGANDEHTYLQHAKAISEALFSLGRAKSADPTSFTEEEVARYFGPKSSAGTTSRCVANRSYSIGWKPTKTTADMLASIKAEVEVIIAQKTL